MINKEKIINRMKSNKKRQKNKLNQTKKQETINNNIYYDI